MEHDDVNVKINIIMMTNVDDVVSCVKSVYQCLTFVFFVLNRW